LIKFDHLLEESLNYIFIYFLKKLVLNLFY